MCILPECHKPKYRDPANNRLHDYCGRSHAMEAQKRGDTPFVCLNLDVVLFMAIEGLSQVKSLINVFFLMLTQEFNHKQASVSFKQHLMNSVHTVQSLSRIGLKVLVHSPLQYLWLKMLNFSNSGKNTRLHSQSKLQRNTIMVQN